MTPEPRSAYLFPVLFFWQALRISANAFRICSALPDEVPIDNLLQLFSKVRFALPRLRRKWPLASHDVRFGSNSRLSGYRTIESPLRRMHTFRSCCETRAGLATGAGFLCAVGGSQRNQRYVSPRYRVHPLRHFGGRLAATARVQPIACSLVLHAMGLFMRGPPGTPRPNVSLAGTVYRLGLRRRSFAIRFCLIPWRPLVRILRPSLTRPNRSCSSRALLARASTFEPRQAARTLPDASPRFLRSSGRTPIESR